MAENLTPHLSALGLRMIACQMLTLRNVAAGEEPYVYSSGNKGPGYLMVKGLVSQRVLLKALCFELALKVRDIFPDVDYVAGNATGGMIPAWVLAEALSDVLGREVPYFYVRGTRKEGGLGEQITGDKQNSAFFIPGRKGLVLEELVNYAETTSNSAVVQRDAGYEVKHAATLVFYDHANANVKLFQNGLKLCYLYTVEQLLSLAEQTFERQVVEDYRHFLKDPTGWHKTHGIEPVKKKELVS